MHIRLYMLKNRSHDWKKEIRSHCFALGKKHYVKQIKGKVTIFIVKFWWMYKYRWNIKS